MTAYVDFYNLMAYDYAGSWDSHASHQSNLYPDSKMPQCTPFSTASALNHYLSSGVPPSKMVLGMPLYGRAFANTDGPGHHFSGLGEGGDGSWETGVWDYKALPRPGATERCHDREGECGASYSYDPQKRVMVSYDTVGMSKTKAEFVKEWGLGGGMWWESSGDKVGEGSLISTFVDGIGGKGRFEEQKNSLEFPESKYENLRKGFPGEGDC
jgi:chitinase